MGCCEAAKSATWPQSPAEPQTDVSSPGQQESAHVYVHPVSGFKFEFVRLPRRSETVFEIKVGPCSVFVRWEWVALSVRGQVRRPQQALLKLDWKKKHHELFAVKCNNSDTLNYRSQKFENDWRETFCCQCLYNFIFKGPDILDLSGLSSQRSQTPPCSLGPFRGYFGKEPKRQDLEFNGFVFPASLCWHLSLNLTWLVFYCQCGKHGLVKVLSVCSCHRGLVISVLFSWIHNVLTTLRIEGPFHPV